jgi:hypothetical protein
MENAQRALWTFLFYALVVPFFVALAVVALVLLAGAFGLGDLLPAGRPALGAIALSAFIWSAVPAILTALALVPIVLRQGGFGWIIAAVAGVLAFAVAAALFPLPVLVDARPYLSFLAGLVAIAVREILVRGGIIVS